MGRAFSPTTHRPARSHRFPIHLAGRDRALHPVAGPQWKPPTPEHRGSAGRCLSGHLSVGWSDDLRDFAGTPSLIAAAESRSAPPWPELMVKSFTQFIEAVAMKSGHPDVIFAIASLVFAALMTLTLRSLIDLL
jgi:hypothetical protein